MSDYAEPIAPRQPQDGRRWDCQCARCGGEGNLGSACIDDLCHGRDCIHGDSGLIPCDICHGLGRLPPRCLSSSEWCEANPLKGREGTSRGELEWF
jgi:hypothetical protein